MCKRQAAQRDREYVGLSLPDCYTLSPTSLDRARFFCACLLPTALLPAPLLPFRHSHSPALWVQLRRDGAAPYCPSRRYRLTDVDASSRYTARSPDESHHPGAIAPSWRYSSGGLKSATTAAPIRAMSASVNSTGNVT